MVDRRVPGAERPEHIYVCPICGRVQVAPSSTPPFCINGGHRRVRMEKAD